jgi:hypothetical protein
MRQRSIGWGAFPDAAIRVLTLIAAQQSDSLCVLDFPWLAVSSYLEDDENSEIGLRVRDYGARGGVP